MEPWILATLAAAAFQTVRFMLHKVLAQGLGATASTFARFAFAWPPAALALAGYLWATGTPLPDFGKGFLIWATLGGAGQILATVFTVLLFARRSFAIGIALKKTEVLQTALMALIVLGEGIGPIGWLAIAAGLVGVLLMTEPPKGSSGLRDPMVILLGLGAGFFFALAGIGYRAATLAVDSDAALTRAGVTLVVVIALQTLAMAAWLAWRAPRQIAATWAARKTAVWLGLSSAAGSWCWFTAFTLQNAALVYAVGQVELILSLAVSVVVFRERVTGRELAGIAVLGGSILLLILEA
jgi:drug/metabolite transporter (DMT)-like permease